MWCPLIECMEKFKQPMYIVTYSTPPTLDDIARKVIRGEYGNGEVRKKLLGELYEPVQDRVNEILGCL